MCLVPEMVFRIPETKINIFFILRREKLISKSRTRFCFILFRVKTIVAKPWVNGSFAHAFVPDYHYFDGFFNVKGDTINRYITYLFFWNGFNFIRIVFNFIRVVIYLTLWHFAKVTRNLSIFISIVWLVFYLILWHYFVKVTRNLAISSNIVWHLLKVGGFLILFKRALWGIVIRQ